MTTPRRRKTRVDLPAHLSDESATQILEFLYEITEAFESRYFAQTRRYYENLRADMMCTKTPRDARTPAPDADDTDPPF